jgi:hypothetical protein
MMGFIRIQIFIRSIFPNLNCKKINSITVELNTIRLDDYIHQDAHNRSINLYSTDFKISSISAFLKKKTFMV